LKDLDLDFLSKISTKVNVIPVIAKADSLSQEEIAAFKKSVFFGLFRYSMFSIPMKFALIHPFIQVSLNPLQILKSIFHLL
jgi:septin family protein